jgi:hypothetical protein
MKSKKLSTDLLAGLTLIGIALVIILSLSFLTMILWNLILPGIILCKPINLWQSMGLLVLVSILSMDKSKLLSWMV